jgi:hypothetical protein
MPSNSYRTFAIRSAMNYWLQEIRIPCSSRKISPVSSTWLKCLWSFLVQLLNCFRTAQLSKLALEITATMKSELMIIEEEEEPLVEVLCLPTLCMSSKFSTSALVTQGTKSSWPFSKIETMSTELLTSCLPSNLDSLMQMTLSLRYWTQSIKLQESQLIVHKRKTRRTWTLMLNSSKLLRNQLSLRKRNL